MVDRLGNSQLLDNLAGQNPFCESDKYSLALTMSQIINQLPANILEMLKSGESIGLPIPEPVDQSPDFTRRMYIQDLYRFFEVKLAFNKDIENPFKAGDGYYKAFFMLHDLFVKDFYIDAKLSLSMFLYKHKRETEVDKLIELYHSESATYQAFCGLKSRPRRRSRRGFRTLLIGHWQRTRERLGSENSRFVRLTTQRLCAGLALLQQVMRTYAEH